ncbi:hypothetical protein QBC42DRAFT_203560 [Cladorrhinum samala]|uniref:Zn(2)-C6 fungal-type domain-containing protein n=1 Tax=Cladorrhinum samala TaxID=585594 RepID=A0AAV9HNB1_9PEZI|nr:hypothetical protein QBC42DRAFT_203560 [Cladorrhinum samala]
MDDELTNGGENTKTANQAWRKRPRKFAPKSRLGCKTCKIRRVKCDQSRPSCLKCKSTGRICDGYSEPEIPPAFKTELDGSRPYYKDMTNSTSTAYLPMHHHCDANRPSRLPMSQNLGPFMVLPVTGPAQEEAMSFFEYISIKDLSGYHIGESWPKTLMHFSQTVPSVRYAAVALALVHRDYLDRATTGRLNAPTDWLPGKAPLLYYNRAIQLLLSQPTGANSDTETTAITLVVCYLFTCFDQLTGNYVQAMKHLRGGVELLRSRDNYSVLNKNSTHNVAKTSGIDTLICQVARQIRRLDMQAVLFLVDWTPANIQDTLMAQLPPPDIAFRSIEQAADHLQVLVAQVMQLRNSLDQQMLPTSDEVPPQPSLNVNVVLEQLDQWSNLFDNMMLQRSSSHETDSETYRRLTSLLRLHHTVAWTYLSSSCGPGREMEYDKFLPQFQKCVGLAREVVAAAEHEVHRLGSLKPTFTPEIGILPALYIIGVKCRHPAVRREILSILRRQTVREAVWDSTCTATVVERVIEIEESGRWEEGEGVVQDMQQIAVWQRIETMSWVQSTGRVDIRYTFCTQDGFHFESLEL